MYLEDEVKSFLNCLSNQSGGTCWLKYTYEERLSSPQLCVIHYYKNSTFLNIEF